MATHAPITGAPSRAPFDPAAWLSQFESAGGAFALTSGGLQLWIVPGDHSDDELSQARRLVSHLTAEQRVALKDRLGAQAGESSSSPSSSPQAPRTPAVAGVSGVLDERTDDMNMMTAIRATTTPTAPGLETAQPMDAQITAAPPRGTHAICDDERGLWIDLPDLRSGRTLDDALAHLGAIAATDPKSYPEEWFEEIRDVGAYTSANYPKEGARHLYVGQTCDEQMDERRRRSDALTKHMHAIEGMYDRVGDFLERHGHCTDNRPRDMRETTAAVRDFVMAGFRVFLHPDGKLGSSGSLPNEWFRAGPERAAEIEDAARRYGRASRRFHNISQIKRAIRLLGTVESNGFTVLQRKGY